jgi:predicted alpha-1,2-mannosidase
MHAAQSPPARNRRVRPRIFAAAAVVVLTVAGLLASGWPVRVFSATVRSAGDTPVSLAALVDTRTWTSGQGNTFPGADVPFGMVQWSPDTMPHRSDGGGYSYGDKLLSGYSLTHLSGTGCPAGGDVPILPMTGPLPAGNPNAVTTSFTHAGEIAQAGYYSARSNAPSTITSAFTATAHTAMGRFTFPRTSAADFLIKLDDSEIPDVASTARIIGDDQVAGSDTTGGFCWENSDYGPQRYTVYFDIIFNHPFTADRVLTEPGQSDPDAVFVTFAAKSDPVIEAHVAISYVSVINAQLDREHETPGWNFNYVKRNAQRTWDSLLGRISVSGGTTTRRQEFYSLLYKDFLQPNITSDVNGQYLGSDLKVHQLGPGQSNQYGIYSGWDIYHSLAQLQAMLDPTAASDMAQSLVNYYSQNGILPQWGYLNLDNYAVLGDPSDAIIADYYAFGARNFDTKAALTDMLRQATTVNNVRPGEALESSYGYLPSDGHYGCCNLRDYVSALLEYDTADFALSRYAAALGHQATVASMQRQADSWINVFDPSNRLLTPRLENGTFATGITPWSTAGYFEGDAYEYLWNVPNDYAGLFSRLGGDAKVRPELQQYLSEPNGQGMHANLSNEFDLGEQYAPDYDGDPAATQLAVSATRRDMFLPGPYGLSNNDDLGAESSQYIWAMLGLYPENPGSGNLVFGSPGFPKAVIYLGDRKAITIDAPGASASRFYVRSLTLNGTAYNRLYVPFSVLVKGGTLDWSLSSAPTSWGSAPQDAPPSYGP